MKHAWKGLMAWAAAAGLAFQLQAQTPASVNWTCMPPDSQNVSSVSGAVSGLPQTASPGFVVRDYSNGPGPDQRWWPYADGAAVSWGDETGALAGRWIQFALAPDAGFSFFADSLTVYLGAKGTGSIRADVAWDTDTEFAAATTLNDTTLVLKKDSDSLYVFPISAEIPDGDTLYVRIYPWYEGSASTSKYLYVRDATIFGSTRGAAFPGSAVWELTDPAAGGTGLAAAVSGLVSAEDENLVRTEINKYSGPDGSQRVRIAGNAWPANQTEQIDSVYVEFRVAPQEGVDFTVNAVSLGIAGNSISTMKANIWFSTDPDFQNPVQIPYDTPDGLGNLPIDALVPVQAALNAAVPSGRSFSLRVYPWVDNDPSVRTGKYLCLKNVVIAGSVTGNVVFDPPTVTTAAVTSVATSSAVSGGNIPSDGGSPVTERGVCWNTEGSPTTADAKTEDGEGSGSFVSRITGLTPGTDYSLRAYAVNVAGTAYGEEVTFRTLDSTVAPTVVTTGATDILVRSAKCGGEVTAWGGDTITVRGICWNTTGDPTTADAKTENGPGLGAFTAVLYPLTENTTYYARAYAVNSAGTGYGAVDTFTTRIPAPAVTKVVAQDGSGDYTTVQAAFDDVPDFYTGSWTIYVKAGIYHEKLLLDRNKTNVLLRGEDPETTILTYDDYAGKAGGTSQSQSVAIDADDFTAVDITFRNIVVNDGSFQDQQAVALRVNGDRQAYYNCRLLGYQDTFYTWGGRGTGRIYLNGCYIEGSVDFIFGRDIVVFDSCEIRINRNGGSLTAASTEPESKFGYVFRDCRITADSIGFNGQPVTSFLLGRPWQAAPRTVFLRCEEPASVDPAGWAAWNVPPALYAEYGCTGPGSDFSRRHAISRQLTEEEAAEYTLENIFSMESNPGLGFDWMPVKPIVSAVEREAGPSGLPAVFALSQNWPNPFNPTTALRFDVPRSGRVTVELMNMRGERVAVLADRVHAAGRYTLTVDGSRLASGVYFCRMQAGSFVQCRKLVLLK